LQSFPREKSHTIKETVLLSANA